jgi:hypothetical protein
MYFTTPAEDLPRPSIPFGIAGVLVLSIGGTVLLGLWPNGILTLAQGARLLL